MTLNLRNRVRRLVRRHGGTGADEFVDFFDDIENMTLREMAEAWAIMVQRVPDDRPLSGQEEHEAFDGMTQEELAAEWPRMIAQI